MDDEKFREMMTSLIFGAFILLLIMMPRFCFKVDEEEYQKLKKEDNINIKKEYLKSLKEKMKDRGPLGAPIISKTENEASKILNSSSSQLLKENDYSKLD